MTKVSELWEWWQQFRAQHPDMSVAEFVSRSSDQWTPEQRQVVSYACQEGARLLRQRTSRPNSPDHVALYDFVSAVLEELPSALSDEE